MHLQKRVQRILTNPAHEWPVIAAEPADIASLYRDYIAVMAAIPSVCLLVRVAVYGGARFGAGLAAAASAAVASYVSTLVGTLLAAVVLQWLAPRFQSRGTTVDALKLVAYASTPVWLGGILQLLPILVPLLLVALIYAIYLFYVGLPFMLKTPTEQRVPLMVVAALAILVLNIVLNFVASGL